jgi:thiol:disulfide interchange protein DsbA
MLQRLLVGVVLIFCAGLVHAENGGKWVEGENYFRVEPPQTTSTPGKIEVLEVFSYACPACNAFQPTLQKLKAALPATAQLAYLPASFIPSEDWPVFQRAFLTAQNLHLVEKTHQDMYDAIWKTRSLATTDSEGHPLPRSQQPTIEDVAKFYAHYGVAPATFLGTANSFAVDFQMKRADDQMMAAQVDSTPTLIVNGQYRLTPQSAGGYEQTIALVKYLVEKESKGK